MGLARLLVLCWMLGLWGAALGAQAAVFSGTPNVAIPDNSNAAADSTITVPNTAPYNAHSIGALQVGLRIDHTRNQDLDIYLVPPGVVWNRSGANYPFPPPAGVIELSTDNGGNNDDYGTGSGPYSYARFSSTADPVYVATQAITAGTVPYTANIYSPEDTADFNARYRTSPVGDWKLVVFDDQGSQTGTLISWELRYVHAYYADPNSAIPDASRTGATSTVTIPANSDRIRTLQVNVRINHNTGNHADIFLIPPWVTWSGPYTLVNSEFSGGDTMNAPFPRGVIELSTDNGGGANFGSGAAVPYTYTRFSAAGDALTPGTAAITGGASAFTAAVYLPEGVFDFEHCYGRSPSGNWTLVVADDQAGTAGTIVSWQILYTPLEPATLHARLGDNNDPGLPIQRGQAGQVLGQFRLDATAATTVTSIVFRESAATNLNGLLTAAALYRDNNGDGLLDGGDTLLATATPAASPNITFNFSQAISGGGGVDLLLTGTVAASPAPASMQMEIQNAAAIAAAGVTVEGQFPRRAGARPFVSATTFTWRPTLPVLIPDNTDSGITSTITVPATSSRIGSLRVGWRVNGTYDADLDFYLLPPGVTWNPPYSQPNNGPVLSMPPRAIELCTDNGGGGNNFGADLSQHHWTYTNVSSTSDPSFAPTTAITAGTAPFTAQTQYTLEGLTAWNMLYAGDPSGTWTLIVVDSWGLDVSYLISWQLEYVPITTPQFWVNAGARNLPGSIATTGQSGQVLGQLALSTFNTAATVTQVILREVNSFNLANNLTAIALYRDNNNDGLFDGGDTLVNAGSMATNVATFNISPTLNVPSDSVVNLLIVATVQATPANTVLELQLLNGADFSGAPAENAPFAVRLGPHPLLEPNTYVSTPTGNINIPDNAAAGITNTITIPATNDLIGALRVGIRIDHARDQDLDIWLIPPGVTWAGPYTNINNGVNVTPPAGVIELSTDNGTGANFGSGSVSFVYTVFSRNGDRRFSPGNTPITGGTAPFTAATGYIEEGTTAFNALYGTNPSGNWTIAIADDQSGSTGRLISWYVQYVPAERAQVNSVPTSGFNDFGNVIVGSPSAAQGFQVQNVGNFSLTLPAPSGTTGIRVTGTHASEFVIQGTAPSGTLAAGASTATFNIVFTPGGTGLRTASITVTWNNSDATMPPTATSNYAIQGTGVQPLIEVRETSIAGPLVANGAAAANGRAFGNQLVGTNSAALTIIVRNTGGTTMTLGTPALGGANPTQFALNLAGFSTSVGAGTNTSFTVTFSPTAAGSFNATVSFTHNATNTSSPFSFAVSGTGVQPIVEVRETNAASGALVTNGQAAANGRAFGNVVVGSSSGALTIFVKNTGTSTMTVGTPSLGGANPAQFALNTSGYSTSIAAGSNTSFTVSFNPTAAGAFTATVSFNHDGQNTASPFSFGVSGTGVQPLIEVRETNAVSGALVTNGQAAANGRAFGNVVVGSSSAALTIFVKNTGTSAMTVGTPALGGANPTQFSLNTSGYTTSIAAGSNTSFTVSFSPAATGSFSATVSFTHNGQNTASPFSFGVSGTGVQPLIEVRETSVAGPLVTNGQAAANGRAFGNQDIAAGPTAALTILVRNTGTSSMTVSVPTLIGADAAQFVLNTSGYTTSVAAGANTSFTVAFDPSTPGAKSATVTFTHDGQNTSSPFTFGVSGTGTQPTMTVAASGSPSETGPTPGSFVITASPAPAVARTVNFTMTGTADFAVGVDYNLSGVSSFNGATGQGTVLVGVSGTATITLTPVNDTRVEALETAIITLDPGSDYALGAPSAATLNITDNDTATITLASSGTPGESGATGTYTVSTSATLEVTLTVNFTMSGVASSSPGVDYNLSATGLSFTGPAGSVTLGPGVAPSKLITLTPVNDTFVEGPETAVMTITAGTQYTGTPSATLTIADNDTATVSVSAAGSPAETGPTSGTFTLTVTPQPRNVMVVNFLLSGSATFGAGFDYTISGATVSSAQGGSGPWLGTVNIPAGTGASVNVNITLTPVNDSIVEGTEDVTLTATADTVFTDPDYSVGSPSSATRNIADNDTATVTVTSSGTPSESGATGSYVIATSATLQYPLTVNFTMSGSATLVLTPSGDFNLSSAGGTYTGPNGTAVLPAGAAPGVTVTLSAVDDSMVEATETATLTLTGGTLITVGAPAGANLSILDNDLATVTVTAAGSPAEAGTVSGMYTIATTATLETPVTINFTMGGLADVNTGVDYTLSGAASYTAGTGTATLAAGVAPSVIITLTPVDDAAVEGPEDAALALQTGAQYTLGAPSSASLTIADNDVTVIAVAASGSPNESGPINGTFTITATPAPQRAMTVNFAMSGTADFGGANPDYTLSGAATFSTVTGLGTVLIGPSGVAVITLLTIDDGLPESTETATLTLNADSVTADPDYSVGSPSADTLSILDNDLPIITVMGGPLNFGGVEIGAASAGQTYTVSGVFLTADIVVSAPAAFEVALASGGPWGSSLNLTPVSGNVPTTTIFVRFAPASLGAASGNVSNASTGATTQDVAVSGTGTGITVSAASLAFGTLYVGTTSAAQSYTLAAEGLSNDLLVNAPTGFELSTTGGAPWLASLNLGSGSIAATTIFVRFAPATVGAFSGNVSNASAGFTPRDISVSGTGVAGVLGISGTQNHGNVPVTQSAAAILYTISNSASGPFAASLTVNSVTLGGANPGDFALSSFSTSLPITLAPSQSFTFLATFTPLAQGVRNANIVINSNSGSEPPANTNYAIFGTGTPGLFAAPPTFPTGVDTGGPVVVQCVISAVSNTTADVAVEYIGGTQTSWTPAIIARTSAGTISGNVIVGMGVLAAGSTLEIYWDAYASERHTTATNYQIRFTPSNGIYGTGTTGTSVAFTLSRNAGWATHDVPTDQLTGRFGHAAVYDAANDRMIVFGGKINGWVTNDVWAYDRGAYNAGWHRLSPTGSLPLARQYGVAVYDAANQRMILFGGWNSIARMNDVWALSLVRGSETWTQVTPAGTPPAGRYFHNFVLDAARSRAVVFGGNGASGMLNDVWTLSLGLGSETWTQLAPSGTPPTPRCGANAVVDAPRDRLVVHGGDIGGGSAQSQVFALSLSPGTETWSALTPAGTAPSPRYVSTVEYAPNRQAMLVSSGYTTGARVTADSFLLDFNGGDVWTPLPADPAANVGRLHGTAVYDAARAELILFGGYNGNAYIQSSLSFLKVLPTPSFTVPTAAGAPTPAARYGVSTVYDTRYGANGRVLMFGGMNPSNRFNDVWWMDPTAANPAWTRMNPTGTPPAARAYAAAVYDGRTGMERMIVFGGQSASGYLNDVWALDLSNPGSESWTQLSASGGPSARIQSAVALDLTFGSERLLMFAGRNTGGNTNDVWQFSLVTLSWTAVTVAFGGSPPVRSNHNVSYDAATNRLVAFLGTGNAGRLADTWAFDLTSRTWANLTPGSGTPSVREGAAAAAVAAGNRVFVHGGYDGGWLTDLWQLDIPTTGPVTWTPLAPANAPVGRNNHGACLSPSGRFYIACGNLGISLNPGSSDIWELDTSSPVAWQQLGQAGAPAAFVHSAEAYDSVNRRMYAFGGLVSGTLDSNLWMLDLASPITAWTAVTPASSVRPAPRRNSKMIFDPVNNRLIVYGGFLARANSSITNELWQFDLGSNTWSQLFVAGGPPGRSSPSMIYDPVTASAVLFGGQTATSHINEVWRLSLGATPSWTLLASGGPAARKGHSAIYDALQHRMIIFGGHNGSSSFSDLWSFNLSTNTWTQHAVAGGPSARHYHTAVYDSTPGLERMILVGGFVGNTLAGGENMQLDLRSGFPMAWSNMPITVARPQPRWGHISVFDEVGRRTVICGGYTDGEIAIVSEGGIPDTWFYGR